MIIDLTHTITPTIPMYPGSLPPTFKNTGTITRTGYRETELDVVSHTGTHMDAPSHILQDGCTLENLPVSQFCGRAIVLDVTGICGENNSITVDFLKGYTEILHSAEFVLFYTGWEKLWNKPTEYLKDGFAVLSAEAAEYLVACGLKGVGTDALSVDPLYHASEMNAHHTLLDGGLVIIESMCLRKVVGRSDLMLFALPMKFSDADGAPVRAVAEFRNFDAIDTAEDEEA